VRVVVRAWRPPPNWRGPDERFTRLRTATPSAFSYSVVSASFVSDEWTKNPRRRTRGSHASIFSSPFDRRIGKTNSRLHTRQSI
jgi:hypothetical protein